MVKKKSQETRMKKNSAEELGKEARKKKMGKYYMVKNGRQLRKN